MTTTPPPSGCGKNSSSFACQALRDWKWLTSSHDAHVCLPVRPLFVLFFLAFFFYITYFWCSVRPQSDILSPKFALEWMSDFEKLQEALDTSGDESYMNSLNRSLALVLDEFYNALTAVGVSAASGDGMPALFKVCVVYVVGLSVFVYVFVSVVV